MEQSVILRIRRQASPTAPSYWEEFALAYKPDHNVISMLMEIRRNPVNRQGMRTTPVVFEANCLEEVCGACTMLIDGRVRQACSALAQNYMGTITLEPMTKFRLIRDLWVNRSVMFEHLKKTKAWVTIDGTYDLGPGPRVRQEVQEFAYVFSRCMTCGCCLEACPQVNRHSEFMGPAVVGQVFLMSQHPTGAMLDNERLQTLMGRGGLADCGNAQNCDRVCPKGIPLTYALAELNWRATCRWLRNLASERKRAVEELRPNLEGHAPR